MLTKDRYFMRSNMNLYTQYFKGEGSDIRHICKITLREVNFSALKECLMLTKVHYFMIRNMNLYT